jgi:hypothetical protein
MDPVIYMAMMCLLGMALTLGVSWAVSKLGRR